MRACAGCCLLVGLLLAACGDDDAGRGAPDAGALPPGTLAHTFPPFEAAAGDEVFGPCQSWTLGNEEELFVNVVHMTNDGGWHHSNWFFVPEDAYRADDGSDGDGSWSCEDRGFDQVLAAAMGGVFFAQSTQSREETQRFPAGTALRIPPRSKIVGGVHVLNVSGAALTTALRFELATLPASEVGTLLAGLALSYRELDLPPRTRSSFSMSCDLDSAYRARTGRPIDFALYYVLPHYHALADGYRLEIAGGPRDGETIVGTDQGIGDPLGVGFEPPLDLSGATGLRVTCTYDNPRSERVGHGIGDQEMCDTLVYTDASVIMAGYSADNTPGDTVDGVVRNEGACTVISLEPPG